MQRTEPDVRRLGALALGAGIVSVVLSWIYFWSPLSYHAAAIVIPVGLLARSHERSRQSPGVP